LNIIEQEKREQAILAGVVLKSQTTEEAEEYLNELALLADTAGADILSRQIQARKDIDPAFFIGKGKAESLALLAKELSANVIIFDDDLSPAQVRNLENYCEVKIIDRSGLILDIFAKRAQTREAKTQVELAQLQYLLPRLTGRWTHLSRQAGGAGIGLRGPGEKQLEVDRRLVKKRITVLKTELEKIGKQHAIRRQHRTDCYKIALMGYTNVGKSTLLNALTKSEVFVENRLFATLDSTVRKMENNDSQNILIVDTVGFIRKLPHNLIASFKSTLEETKDADLLLHVIDISSPAFREQIKVVQNVMNELKISQKPVLNVFNKVDQLKNKEIINVIRSEFDPCIIISAQRGILLDELRNEILNFSNNSSVELDVKVNLNRQKDISQIYALSHVLDKQFDDGYVNIKLRINKTKLSQLERLIE